MQLNRFGRNLHSYLRRVELCHRRLYRIGDLRIFPVLVLLSGSLVYKHLGSLYLGCHIRQLELCVLEGTDALSELLSFLNVFDRRL